MVEDFLEKHSGDTKDGVLVPYICSTNCSTRAAMSQFAIPSGNAVYERRQDLVTHIQAVYAKAAMGM